MRFQIKTSSPSCPAAYSEAEHINIGSGKDLPIGELAHLVCEVVGFEGEIARNLTKPDGAPRKLMSSERLTALGWQPRIALREGLANAYEYLAGGAGTRPGLRSA
jgi:GDP-L-fucose synthase